MMVVFMANSLIRARQVLAAGVAPLMLLGVLGIQAVAQSGPGPVDAGVNTTVRFRADPTADSWPFSQLGTGQQTWSFNLYNHAGEPNTVAQTFSGPQITVTNAIFPSITGAIIPLPYNPLVPPPAATTTAFPFTYAGTLVGPFNSASPAPSFGFGWASTDKQVEATAGFTVSRTVSPLVIPGNATIQQTVTMTVIPMDPARYTSGTGLPFISASMGIAGLCVQVIPAGANCGPGGANLSVNSPLIGQPQTLSATFEVTNTLPYPVMSKPWMTSQMNIAPIPSVSLGKSTTISDPSLGDVTFALNEQVEWHPRNPNLTFIVDLPGFFAAAIDTTPPVITPNLSGPSGSNGWYTGPVNLTWTVSDPESGIATSAGCGSTRVTSSTVLTCSATNGAGLTSSVSVTIKIDSTSPSISGMPAAGCSLWPPNNKLVLVGSVSATAGPSGVASFSVSGTSNEPAGQNPDILITGSQLQPRAIQLRAQRLGTGTGRVYSLIATTTNGAGVSTQSTAVCVVPHDQGH